MPGSPTALANRSFLYGGARPPPATGEPIVYATLDSLALQLQRLPASDDQPPSPRPIKTKPAVPPKPSPASIEHAKAKQELPAEKAEPIDIADIASSPPRKSEATQQGFEGESNGYEYQPAPPKKRQPPKNGSEGPKKERLNFAKNVLHYVPMTSRRYYRKSRKLASKSLSLKSLAAGDYSSGLKTRSLSRAELKYVTISLPSNFVHVASATQESLTPDAPVAEARRKLVAHAGKYGDLGHAEYAEIAVASEPAINNDSFLWGRLGMLLEAADDAQWRDEDYDDVGPPVGQDSRTAQRESADPGVENEPAAEDSEQDAYDDVILAPEASPSEELVYDDVGPMPGSYADVREPESVEQPDEDVYDDVGPPTAQPACGQDCHERVNSLYAGSSLAGSNGHDKESEWEDLDDAGIYGDVAGPKITDTGPSLASKKKLAGQRWSRKVRRQRSRASRKSSGRSTSHSRSSRPKNPDSFTVAVSLGAGSVLLLGPRDEAGKEQLGDRLPGDNAETRGLVQLRLVLLDEESDVQETSLYVEDSSDDSNYETLETIEPDDFSSESETESRKPEEPRVQEPPSRPVPPPPREASLGHTLGRRMKMLRRTWSLTKGSLGRMRRRASGECEPGQPQQPPAELQQPGGPGDARKYFSFKKHFRRSQATGFSTFYLDKAACGPDDGPRDEPIYANGDWYQEAGLYETREDAEDAPRPEPPVVDHYSVLAEEPLYQFYTDAATRVAFESDSDGYEEVEEPTPLLATTNLAKPGHRTLWCQTPQVINSGLLQSMTAEERKIQEAKFEILTSEASYLNSLRVLENEFASSHELVHEALSSIERDRLFGSVPEVLVASERFLAELEAVWRADPRLTGLAELLLKHAERSADVYVNYCSNQVSIDMTLKDLRAKKGYKFLEAVSRIESRSACQSLSLHSFLMLPMQRITRLPLLADAVLSKLSVDHSERLSWEAVLAALSHVVAKCNEGARLAERRNEMDALARKLEYPSKVPPVDLWERELIRSGMVVHLSNKSDNEYKLTFGKKFHKTPLILMLLTDYLLVTKLKSNSNEETYSVMDTCKRSLVVLESAPEDSPFAGRHAMVLTLLENHAGRQVEYVLACENETEKERWLDAVSPPKPSCVGETLYESWDCPQVMAVFSYAPRQPDELALQPGDVINVLRKMNDKWLCGEKLLDGEQGWFPENFTKEVASEHVRARNLRQRHRFLALSGSVLQRKAKQSLSIL